MINEAGKKLLVQNESRTMNQDLIHRPASYVRPAWVLARR